MLLQSCGATKAEAVVAGPGGRDEVVAVSGAAEDGEVDRDFLINELYDIKLEKDNIDYGIVFKFIRWRSG